MALIGNYSVLNKTAGRWLAGGSTAGTNAAQTRANVGRNSDWRKFSLQDRSGGTGSFTLLALAAKPSGYYPPGAWALPSKSGAISSSSISAGVATASGAIADGRNISGSAAGTATVSGTGSLVVSGSGSAAGVATVSGNVQAAIVGSASAAGSSTASGSMTANGYMSASAAGAASVSATIAAIGYLAGSITPYTELSPQTLAAEVWGAASASFNESGTMGAKVNAAASSGDPWSTELPGSYAVGTAGYILGTDLTPDNIATRLLDIADAIEQELTVRKALRLVAASLAGKMSGLDTSTVTIRSAYADDKDRIVATVDAEGNRSAITYDLSD